MEIKLVSEVEDKIAYEVFVEGYSDYMFKFNMSLEMFVERFLENEADRSLSYIVFEDDKAIGICLGNIKEFNGIKTMRCGGFAVIPECRSKGIGQILLDKHYELAKENKCQQVFLEVIKDNTGAVSFYKRNAYQEIHDYRAYKNTCLNIKDTLAMVVKKITFEEISQLRQELSDLYLHWQGEIFTVQHFDNINHYGVYDHGKLMAALSLSKNGSIHYLWVNQTQRLKGYGKSLLAYGVKDMNLERIGTVSSNNFVYEGFLRKLEFELVIEQHEMMKLVK